MNKNTVGFAIVVVLLLGAGFFSINLYFREKTSHDKLDIKSFPKMIGNWKGQDVPVTEREYSILETRNLVNRIYTDPSGSKLYLFIIYSETNRAVFHPPEVCMIGSGIAIIDRKVEQMDEGKHKLSANRILTEKGHSRDMALYCYKAGDIYTDKFYLQQVYLAFHQVLGQKVPGATIRVSMPVIVNETATADSLKSFLKETIRIIDNISN